ncbi:glycosyltransferase family 2 protein [Dermacoccus abyssi]|uniref:glycosyltransferase family 2 protein n=1 Tax=Dermacoccus abyssi TaxID=322596 RepID=UPI002AD54BAC|nr:hypothetical protein [Dermacoccus abyssi]
MQESVTKAGIPHVSIQANPGFGAAVTSGLNEVGEWDWVLVINDDIELEEGALLPHVEALPDAMSKTLIFLDPVEPKRIPGMGSTLGQVSLISAPVARLRRVFGSGRTKHSGDRFRPFSIVMISRGLWDGIGGLDEDMPYTFEDADFARRAELAGADLRFPATEGIRHPASSTSKRHVDKVVPVAAWSAASYMTRWYTPPGVARALCAGALATRALFVPITPADRRSHLVGIRRGISALLTNRKPDLPDFDSV